MLAVIDRSGIGGPEDVSSRRAWYSREFQRKSVARNAGKDSSFDEDDVGLCGRHGPADDWNPE